MGMKQAAKTAPSMEERELPPSGPPAAAGRWLVGLGRGRGHSSPYLAPLSYKPCCTGGEPVGPESPPPALSTDSSGF